MVWRVYGLEVVWTGVCLGGVLDRCVVWRCVCVVSRVCVVWRVCGVEEGRGLEVCGLEGVCAVEWSVL